MNTHTIVATPFERLFYEIQAAQTHFDLTLATIKIPSIAPAYSREYKELIEASGAKWIELDQAAKARNN